MTHLSKVADLHELSTAAKARLAERAKKIEVKVHLGTCGIASGAKAVQEAFVREVNSRKLADVAIAEAACIGPCGREPRHEEHYPRYGT